MNENNMKKENGMTELTPEELEMVQGGQYDYELEWLDPAWIEEMRKKNHQ